MKKSVIIFSVMVFAVMAVSTAFAAKEISINSLKNGDGYVTIEQARKASVAQKAKPAVKKPAGQKDTKAKAVVKKVKAKVPEKSLVKKRLRRHKRPVAVKLPQNTTQYKVVRGDSLWRIAKATGTSVPVLAKLNGIRNPARIDAGWVIKVPTLSREEKLAVLEKEFAGLTERAKKVQEEILKLKSSPVSSATDVPVKSTSASISPSTPDSVTATAVPTLSGGIISI